MPIITELHTHTITVEKFLDNCSASELHEINILLNRPKYHDKMYPDKNADVVELLQIGNTEPNL